MGAEKYRLVVEGLRGTRPVAPFPQFGQSRTPVQSAQLTTPDGAPILPGQQVWVGLSAFHVLEPSGLKVLIYPGNARTEAATLATAQALVRAARGPASLVDVVATAQAMEQARNRLHALQHRWFAGIPRVEVQTRQGDFTEQLVGEAIQGYYEIVVMAHPGGEPDPIVSHLCQDFGLPVLLVPQARPHLKRVLICTAGGEPGKTDIKFGGRIARRARAQVTLFHIQPAETSPVVQKRTQTHLQKGQSLLTALGVTSQIKVERGLPVVEGILAEVDQGNYDLIVIGAPAPRAPQKVYWADLAVPIASRVSCPLLIVPMVE